MLLTSDERFGGIPGEVAVHDFPAFSPAGDGMVIALGEIVPLIVFVQIHKAAFPIGHQ
ncbi:hypothetical protein D3C73_1616320 [compost metagenome]